MSEPMEVRRVEHKGGSRIEPPVKESWDDFTKLRWKAGCVLADAGVRVTVRRSWLNPRRYMLCTSVSGFSDSSADHCWTLLTGIEAGAKAALREVDRGEPA